MEKIELIDNLKEASERLKNMKDLIVDKYSNIEANLYKEKTKNQNLEKKYKGLIKQMQVNEKKLEKENMNLKNLINEKENERNQMEINFQNQINQSMYNNNNQMGNYPMSNEQMNDYNNYMNNYIYPETRNFTDMSTIDDPNEGRQKKSLEDFKKLLNKIDEKLDTSFKFECE